MALTRAPDATPANWITGSALPWWQLATFGPGGFEAYARVRLLPDPARPGQSENDVTVSQDHPSDLSRLQLATVLLRRHTTTPQDCFFAIWDGWGEPLHRAVHDLHLDSHSDSDADRGHRMVIPHRAYLLVRGPLEELDRWDVLEETAPGRLHQALPEPAFIWPRDHAWCVAHDVDPHWIGVGGAAAAIEELIEHPGLDVVPADPAAAQPRYR